jgi:hypothetical protein
MKPPRPIKKGTTESFRRYLIRTFKEHPSGFFEEKEFIVVALVGLSLNHVNGDFHDVGGVIGYDLYVAGYF